MGFLSAFTNAPFAPTYNPAYWATGGKAPDKMQDPRYMSQYYKNGGGVARTGPAQTTGKTYATQGTTMGTRDPNSTFASSSDPWAGKPVAPGNTNRTDGASGGQTGNGPDYGSQSGPGILENWFNQRATGIDAASQYATKRGMEALDSRYGAVGLANSGAARQGESDLLANIEAQREAQLDALAAGASGEHIRRNEDLFNIGDKIASDRSAINSSYDLAGAKAWADALAAALGLGANKAGVDSQSNQQGITNLMKLYALFQ